MIIGAIVWSLGACIFLLIGRSCWKAKEATGFFTGVKPPKVKDVIAYNHAVAKIWYAFAAILEINDLPVATTRIMKEAERISC